MNEQRTLGLYREEYAAAHGEECMAVAAFDALIIITPGGRDALVELNDEEVRHNFRCLERLPGPDAPRLSLRIEPARDVTTESLSALGTLGMMLYGITLFAIFAWLILSK